jgi:hypothetical protein
MAASVPGRGRNQRSANSAAWVRNGSMTTTLQPRSLARFISIHCGGSAAAGLRPTSSRQAAFATSSPPVMAVPVIRSLTARQPPQRSWLIIQFGEPRERISSAITGPRLKAAPLTAPTRAGPPWRARTAARFSAISSRAASQPTRSHRPEPRAPTRRNGWVRRAGW